MTAQVLPVELELLLHQNDWTAKRYERMTESGVFTKETLVISTSIVKSSPSLFIHTAFPNQTLSWRA